MDTLEEFNEKGNIIVSCRDKNERDFHGSMIETGSLCRVRIDDPDNHRWTDAWFGLEKQGNVIRATVQHEKGYPSEEKGVLEKEVKLNWLDDEPPKP